ncbi:hypothetical protein J7I98_09370 [Streptomyces sp. ISL-98]|uniref:pilus assembly protein TadG-related protein n=1 Tax=Streptomyces sp. ISL-98 TaxID=2819192 RepID=UPI001BE6D8AC|nr:pilus assembly protein TadG-related protein [Streptomyces sp. ISL-98]MBT2506102.1 hypothetical protein [Streptomyces sp. ISL-98]
MIAPHQQDRGQTLPIYVVVVGGLLFLAFVYFAFAQAAVARNGAQSAADAAALAAAQDVRDELTDGFEDSIGDADKWIEWILAEGNYPGLGYEAAARQLAGENDADLLALNPTLLRGDPAFAAEVKTRYTVGESAIPGTEKKKAVATATAVIEPRCTVTPSSNPLKLIEFDCEGSGHWEIDPKDFVTGDLPEAKDLYSVHLAE